MGTKWLTDTPRRFVIAAAVAAAAVIAFIACLAFQLPNPSAVVAMDDIGEAVAAIAAAGAAVYAARVTAGRVRLGWSLLAISAACWGLGEVVWAVYEVFLHQAVPYPGWSDVGFLAAVPFAFAGVRAFWRDQPRTSSSRLRVWLDGAVVAASLMFTAWVLGLQVVWQDSAESGLARFLDLAYPIGDILIGTVLILALRRATRRRATRMLVVLCGIAANALADSAFTYLTTVGGYTVHGSVLDAGWVVGYTMIGFAAVWPRSPVSERIDTAPVDLWQVALPWLAVMSAGASAVYLALRGQSMSPFLTGLLGTGAALLTLIMILTSRDLLRMLVKSQASEATLAEVIAQAPAGVVRISTDLRILDANPRFLDLVHGSIEDTKGVMITRFFGGQVGIEFAKKLELLSSGLKEAVEGDGQAMRTDGTDFWVHWSATAVPTQEKSLDYFIAMFEDTTARHDAEAAAAANLELMQRLNAVKTEFLQSVSHEFKTALIGIQGFSEFMRDADQLDIADARSFAADIYRDAERLDRMVSEMLALDEVQTRRSDLDVQPVDLGSVVRRAVAGARERAAANPIDLDLQPHMPEVVGDAAKLEEVVRALLDNAVRRSPEGEHITVMGASNGGGVEIKVVDHGTGPISDFDNRLFGNDELYANNPIRKVVGTGLDLGIARHIVEMHGGRMWVNGGGSEMHFTIPVLWRNREAALAITSAPVAVA